MPYPEALVDPMRQELVRLGVDELRTADDVDAFIAQPGTAVVVINSVCGCAAANARPAVALARRHTVQPDRYATVFAGQDMEATARLREHLAGIPPSSPFITLLSDGDPVVVIERRHIEGRSASAIAGDLVAGFERYCGGNGEAPDESAESRGNGATDQGRGDLPNTFRSIL